MNQDETIVAIATPFGEGGLGVVRLSGSHAFEIAAQLFKSPRLDLKIAPTHTLHFGWIESAGQKIDEVIASLFRAPKSYTGEDVVELSCHGSPAVLKEVVQLCVQHGARIARPGEFTERAYLNGKMDLAQAEAVAALIHSSSTASRKAASAQLQGVLSIAIKKIRQDIIDLLARIEANLDFVEEDIPEIKKGEFGDKLSDVRKNIENLLSTSLRGKILRNGFHIVLAGRPNVGKSSLFNALLAHDRAIVTNLPGTTRDTLTEKLEWGEITIHLTDTAGLRSTFDPIEKLGKERSKKAQMHADLVLLLLNGEETVTFEDEALINRRDPKKSMVVINKADLEIKCEVEKALKISAKTGLGLIELKEAIQKFINANPMADGDRFVLTNVRHIRHLEIANGKLLHAEEALVRGSSEEVLSLDLKEALKELGAITGEDVTEDVLTAIFRQFCIGK